MSPLARSGCSRTLRKPAVALVLSLAARSLRLLAHAQEASCCPRAQLGSTLAQVARARSGSQRTPSCSARQRAHSGCARAQIRSPAASSRAQSAARTDRIPSLLPQKQQQVSCPPSVRRYPLCSRRRRSAPGDRILRLLGKASEPEPASCGRGAASDSLQHKRAAYLSHNRPRRLREMTDELTGFLGSSFPRHSKARDDPCHHAGSGCNQ